MRVISKLITGGRPIPEDITVYNASKERVGVFVGCNHDSTDCSLDLDHNIVEENPDRWVKYKTYVMDDAGDSRGPWFMVSASSILKAYERRHHNSK